MSVTQYGCVFAMQLINIYMATMNHFFSLMEVANNYYASRMSNTFCMEEYNVCVCTYYINIHIYQQQSILKNYLHKMNGCMCSLPLKRPDKAGFSKLNGSSCVVAKLYSWHIPSQVRYLCWSVAYCHTRATQQGTIAHTYVRTYVYAYRILHSKTGKIQVFMGLMPISVVTASQSQHKPFCMSA